MLDSPTDTSVYIHFPWCARKCPYCDFATRKIAADAVPHREYADALLRELALRAPSLGNRRLYSVFFGGGTPSLWSGQELGRVLKGIRDAFPSVHPNLEVSAESNPASLTQAKAAAFREAGVGRLSIGVQSLNDERLRFLGRLHDRDGALRALRDAQKEIPRVSGDLMFGMPDQNAKDLENEIDALLDTGVNHVSAYALTLEMGTRFYELHRLGKLRVAREEMYAEMFLAAHEHFARHGFAHYEVSNYARPGQTSRHNEHYWRGHDYLALGAAAVGCLGDHRYRNEPLGERYLEKVANADHPSVFQDSYEELDGETRVREAWMLGLRTAHGVDAEDVYARTGRDALLGREEELEHAINKGDLVKSGARYHVPHERWLRLDGIVRDIF